MTQGLNGQQVLTMAPEAIAIFDIDGVVRDVGRSYRRAIADTVEHFTTQLTGVGYRPSLADIDMLKSEGIWNNDWRASQELVERYCRERGQGAEGLSYEQVVDFFQRRYRGNDLENPAAWDGYICDEPLLMSAEYLQGLTEARVAWGFFSGATPGSARFVLERRLGLVAPPLVAMGDAPDKPDPTGLIHLAQILANPKSPPKSSPESPPVALATPVIYAGDTVADMVTVERARQVLPATPWIGVGVLPPHVHADAGTRAAYAQRLRDAGASLVVMSIEELDSGTIGAIASTKLRGRSE